MISRVTHARFQPSSIGGGNHTKTFHPSARLHQAGRARASEQPFYRRLPFPDFATLERASGYASTAYATGVLGFAALGWGTFLSKFYHAFGPWSVTLLSVAGVSLLVAGLCCLKGRSLGGVQIFWDYQFGKAAGNLFSDIASHKEDIRLCEAALKKAFSPHLSVATRLKKYGILCADPAKDKKATEMRKLFTRDLARLRAGLENIEPWYQELPTGQGLENISFRLRPEDKAFRSVTHFSNEDAFRPSPLRYPSLTLAQAKEVRSWSAAAFEGVSYDDITTYLRAVQLLAKAEKTRNTMIMDAGCTNYDEPATEESQAQSYALDDAITNTDRLTGILKKHLRSFKRNPARADRQSINELARIVGLNPHSC